MNKMNIFLVGIIAIMFIFLAPTMTAVLTKYESKIDKAEQNNTLASQKQAEDTLRATLTNYNNYKNEYESYSMFCEEETFDDGKCSRAINSKTSANNSANSYNTYYSTNSNVFANNKPEDLPEELTVIN